jgi:hypothetical protein
MGPNNPFQRMLMDCAGAENQIVKTAVTACQHCRNNIGEPMKFKQRLCGFRGHQSKVYESWVHGGPLRCVRLICTKCGYKTKWFEVDQRLPNTVLKSDG